MKKILLSCAACLLALGLVSACDLDNNTPDLEEDTTEEETDLTGSDDGDLTSEEEDLTTEYEPEEFTIWAPIDIANSLMALVSDFSNLYPEFSETYKVRVEVQGEGDAATNVINDVSSAADIYFFAQDQLAPLITAGGLSAVPSSSVSDVTSRNDATSISAATSGKTLYAYPATADNGYFVFYDKSVEGLEEEMTREGGARQSELIKIASEQSKTIDFEITSSGWYLASYFIATGCESTWCTDASGEYINYVDTWNSDEGLVALKGAYELISSYVFVNNSDAGIALSPNSSGMLVVSGTWDSNVAKNLLGSNFGVAPLWNFTVDSQSYHLGSFYGCKLVGVKPNADATKNGWTHLLANYLTSEEAQMMYYEETNAEWVPCNLNAQNSDEVLDNEVLQGLFAQSEYAVPQGQYPNDWWTITQNFGAKIAGSGGTDEALKALLAEYDESISKIIGKLMGDYAITGNLADEATWSVRPEVGVSKYALYEDNAEEGTYSKDSSGVVHGKWSVEVELVGGGCYVTSSGTRGDGSAAGDIELGLVRVCDYGEWTGNWGYKQLTDTTGYYDWDSTGLGGGIDNNIGAVPGSYTFVFDYTGSTPAITMTSAR